MDYFICEEEEKAVFPLCEADLHEVGGNHK